MPITEEPIVRGNGQQQHNRVLTLKHERDIVNNLSFLSAITSDPDKVMALCIEESYGGEEISIRIAANTGDLERLKMGIQRMARVLEAEAAYGLRPW